MSSRAFRLSCFVALCSPVLLSAAVAADGYEVKITRPEKVGSKYELTATTQKKESMTVTMGETVVQSRNKNVKARLTGTVEILKVNDESIAVKKKLTVQSFQDGEEEVLLKKGTVVFAELVDGKTQHRLADGSELTGTAKDVIGDLFDTQDKTTKDIEQALESKKRRKIGESWTIKSDNFAKTMKVDPKAVKGTAKLEKIIEVNGHKCLQLAVKMTISDFPGGEALKKQGFEKKSINFGFELSALLPIDKTVPTQSFSGLMNMKAHLQGPNAVELKMDMNYAGKKSRKLLK